MVQSQNSQTLLRCGGLSATKNILFEGNKNNFISKVPPQERESNQDISFRRSSKGSINVLFLTTLPLLFLIITGTACLFGAVQQIVKDKKTCRNELLNGQVRAGQEIRKLLALNSRAIRLYKRLQNLKKQQHQCVLGGGVVCLKIIRLSIMKVEMDRTLLSLQQQQHLLLGQSHLRTAVQRVKGHLKSPNFAIDKAIVLSPASTTNHGLFLLAVEPEYLDRAPPYKLKDDFSSHQQIGMTWSKNINFPLILQKNKALEFGCAATLLDLKAEYLAVLKAVRPSLSSRSLYY